MIEFTKANGHAIWRVRAAVVQNDELSKLCDISACSVFMELVLSLSIRLDWSVSILLMSINRCKLFVGDKSQAYFGQKRKPQIASSSSPSLPRYIQRCMYRPHRNVHRFPESVCRFYPHIMSRKMGMWLSIARWAFMCSARPFFCFSS